MGENNVSLKEGRPFYAAGIASIIFAFMLFPNFFSSWYYNMIAVPAFFAAGLMFYLGWTVHSGRDTREFDNDSGGRRIYPTPLP